MWAKLSWAVVVLSGVSGCASSEGVGDTPNQPSAGGSVATGATSGLGATGGGGSASTGGSGAGGTSAGGASGSAGQSGSGGAASGPPAAVSGQVVQLLDWHSGVADVL